MKRQQQSEAATLDVGGVLDAVADAERNEVVQREKAQAAARAKYVGALRRASAGKATPDDVDVLRRAMAELDIQPDAARRDSEALVEIARLEVEAAKLPALEAQYSKAKTALDARLVELKEQEDAARRGFVALTYQRDAAFRATNKLDVLRQQRPVLFE